MVYCNKCGTQNADTNNNCINCGAPLYPVGEHNYYSDKKRSRSVEREPFGLPNGGLMVGIIIGLIVIVFGLNFLLEETYGFSIPFWPFIMITFGVLLVISAIYRNRRYRQRSA